MINKNLQLELNMVACTQLLARVHKELDNKPDLPKFKLNLEIAMEKVQVAYDVLLNEQDSKDDKQK